MTGPLAYSAGQPRPLGASPRDGGVNFSLFADHATLVELLLYSDVADEEPAQVIRLEHRQNRSARCWHVFVAGAATGQAYAWRVHGQPVPERGLLFDGAAPLLDPYARLVVPRDRARLAGLHGPQRGGGFVSVVADPAHFEWGGTRPPRPRPTERVIYEMHVGGFSRHGSARALHPGTFEAMIAKIPYLVDLGITTVELMPIFSFDADAPDRVDPLSGRRLRDFWGYNPLGFFAPHADYLETDGRDPTPLARLQELVKALHAADLEVFLDVVFNHTGEGDHRGPMHSLRGIDNPTYYIVKRDGSGEYQDFSGCGNTVNCNHPGVRRMILDSLRYWTKHFKIDGFRFDLAAVLSRDEDGRPLEEPPLIWEIEGDPELERTTLIAEAWDAAGLYQVGRFPGERWCEWNGRFRDDVRRFWRGDQGLIGALAQRLLGSPDLYEAQGRSPSQGVNFITCHDGFTLHDLVSYATRHNHANGEQNRDGAGEEFSSNHGVEGPTRDPETIALRARQTRNLLTTLLVSQGTPMLLAGDEFGRTQRGNNNPWCQDNEVSWIDWGLLAENAALHRFVRTLLRFRRSHHSLHRSEFLLGFDAPVGHDTPGYTRVRWHGIEPGQANWDDNNRLLCMMLTPASDDVAIHVILNAGLQPVTVRLSTPPSGHRWLRVIDTSLASPDDIREPNDEVPVLSANYRVESRSSVVLIDESPPPARGHATQRIVLPESLR